MARKVRIYSPFFPYPTSEGAYHVIYNQLRYFSSVAEVELVTWMHSEAELQKKISALPRPLPRTKFTNLFDHVRHFRSRGTRLAVAAYSKWASPELAYYPLLKRKIQLAEVDWEIFHYSFCSPWLGTWTKNSARTACYFHNIESELFVEKAQSASNPLAKAYHMKTVAKLERHENALADQFDELWFVSEPDKERFVGSRQKAKLRYVPPIFDEYIDYSPARIDHRKTIYGFIGALNFIPNVNSVAFLVNQVAPLISASDHDVEIHVVGKDVPDSLKTAAARFPFIKFFGFVENTESFWNSIDALLIPHMSGSGVRIKLLESLARRVPVVANRAAVERIDPKLLLLESLHVVEEPAAWATLLLNSKLRTQRIQGLSLQLPSDMTGVSAYRFIEEKA